ncbi:heparan-alpha-glucosaminide N-acetyltransferase domain-containing protein [Brevibacterium jeotgali]|uniref:Heparan-alpha-glucosaminide N-acetyltransferase catalytic domain-containing protein n=1 Tax=Brevibacterium jeotgali TaxID=1262550 RepID=A0A2H1L344_9MICO|nr:heparan-alpha-glucosaminide N-acetyltransferase domain-containing protein [Brevibacterium jeotgali]TWC02530.1 uncharacterized protein DUF1624 [Brevibacterium jeotgali]SMY11322.1 Protein of unknown function (DUF1624) [Brevibacterium jeotgali]
MLPTPASSDPHTPRPPLRSRILGVDLARGLALFGMMATHVLPRMDEAGDLTAVALLQGRASALFAVLAGFSIILSTRSALAHTGGRGWAAASVGLVIRGALIALIGLALGELPSGIAIILVNYGVLFLIAPLFLRFPTWLLGLSAWAWFLLTPQLSHAIRSSADSGFADSGLLVPAFSNMHLADTWIGLLLTGYYPLLQWVGYILLGMWLARIDWSDLHRRVTLLISGGALTTLALAASALLMNMRGRWELESLYGEESVTDVHTYVDRVVMLGAYGVTPADSPWWLVTAGPHSGTTFDLVQTSGVAMAVLGLCLLVGPLLDRGPAFVHTWLSRPGSTPLSMYTLHICILALGEMTALRTVPGMDTQVEWFWVNVVVVIVAALVWTGIVSRRGPLEAVLAAAVRTAQRSILVDGPADGRNPADGSRVSGPQSPQPPPSV